MKRLPETQKIIHIDEFFCYFNDLYQSFGKYIQPILFEQPSKGIEDNPVNPKTNDEDWESYSLVIDSFDRKPWVKTLAGQE